MEDILIYYSKILVTLLNFIFNLLILFLVNYNKEIYQTSVYNRLNIFSILGRVK